MSDNLHRDDLTYLRLTADRIDTGTINPTASRALVVFNLTNAPLEGVAVFEAVMSWPSSIPLPPVRVADLDGVSVPAIVTNIAEGPDAKGRFDRRQLSFSLCFAVSNIFSNGWRTYIAAYEEMPSPPLQNFVDTPGLVVVETTRHGGELPPFACFADLPLGWIGDE